MTTLDFRKQRKACLKVTLSDKAETRLSLLQPTKSLFQKMASMSEEVGSIDYADLDALDEVYGVCAELMSRNREGIEVTAEQLAETLDFEDIVVFLQSYGEFVASVIHGSGKN